MKTLNSKSNSIKTKLLVYLLSVVLIFSGIGLTLLTNNFGKNDGANDVNAEVTTQANGFGMFANGTSYMYTDYNKIGNFRAGSIDSDTTTVTVNTAATHGTKNNPYVIANIAHWEALAKESGSAASSVYVLAKDLDFQGVEFHPVATFQGQFYGQGYKIKNVTANSNSWKYWNGSAWTALTTQHGNGFGIFCRIGGPTELCDVIVDNYNFTGYPSLGPTYVGGIVGTYWGNNKKYFTNCHSKGSMNDGSSNIGTGSHTYRAGIIGGFYAANHTGEMTFYRCSAETDIFFRTASAQCSGAIAAIISTKANFYDCYGLNKLNTTACSSYLHSSSMLGWQNAGTAIFEECVGLVDILRSSAGPLASGALACSMAANTSSAKNCYAEGIVGPANAKRNMQFFIGNGAGNRIENTNDVYAGGGWATTYTGCVAASAQVSRVNRADLISNAKTFFSSAKFNKIWDVQYINFDSYTVDTSPVRNYLKTFVPTTQEVEYNGEEFDFATMYADAVANGILTVGKADTSKNYTDVGTYTFNVAINDSVAGAEDYVFDGLPETTRSTTVTVKIKPAKINISGTLPITEYGVLKDGVNLIDLTDGLYSRDLTSNPDGAPAYVLEYRKSSSSVWTETVPTVSGEYYVRAKITNPSTCNYTLAGDGQTKFTLPKQNVAVPYFTGAAVTPAQINGTVTTVPYTGDYQVFKLVNSADGTTLSGVTVGARSGSNGNALMYNKATGEFRAKEVGTYTVSLTLSDGGANTRWANYQNTSETRIITIVITKAELNVTILNSSVTSWQKGEVEAITAYVTGIKNDEAVKVKVTCGATGETPTELASDAMTQSGDTITIKVNLASFAANKSYKMQISLAPESEASANANYTLNTLNTSFDFFILTAVIDNVPIVWNYDNLIAGYNQPATDNQEVDYNGQPYDMKLDETQLPNGIKATYKHELADFSGAYSAVDECLNVGEYRTTVTIEAESGYELASNINTVYTIAWEIKAIEYDLSQLIFADNPQWTGMPRKMSITNAPDWMTVNGQNDSKVPVGSYVGTWTVEADDNHIFKIGSVASGVTELDNDGKIANLQYTWEITEAAIPVSNSTKKWVDEEKISSNGTKYKVKVPDVYAQYGSMLKLTYYDKDDNEVDINTIEVTDTEVKQYYCIVTLNDAAAGSENYKVVNETNGSDFAKLAFYVGDDKYAIEVTFTPDDDVIYDGQPHGVTVTPIIPQYASMQIGVTYYEISYNASGDAVVGAELTEAPTEVGDYMARAEVTDTSGNFNGITILNKSLIYSIKPLNISAESWGEVTATADNPFGVPSASVTSDLDGAVPTDLYGYKVYAVDDFKANGTKATPVDLSTLDPKPYNTKYIVAIVPNPDGNTNVKIDESSPYYHEFTTAPDPEGEYLLVPDPVPVKNIYEVTGEPITVQLKDWTQEYADSVEIVSGSLTETAIGKYTVKFKIKDGVRAQWAWEGDAERELNFEIIGKVFQRPTFNKEIRYTGEEIVVTDFIEGFDSDWMEALGDATGTVVGDYRVVIMLKDPANSSWADEQAEPTPPAPASFVAIEKAEISLMSNVVSTAVVSTADSSVSFDWEIKKAQVTGTWTQTEEGYQQYVPTDPAMSNFLDYEYFEADGVTPVAVEDMAEGGSYVAKAKVKPEHSGNVEFLDDAGNPAGEEVQMPFTFEVPKSFFAGLMAGLLNFVNLNWKILVIAAAVLLLGIVACAVIKHLKNSKEKRADAKAKKAADKKTKEIAKQQEKAKQKQEKERQKALEKQAQKNGVSVEQQKQINAMNGVNPDGTPAINSMMAGMMGAMAGATMANAMGANGMPNGVAANGMPMTNGAVMGANGMPMANGAVGVNATMPNAMAGGTVAGVNGVGAVGVNGMPMANGVVTGANGVPVANGIVGANAMGVGASGVLNALGGFGANGVTLVSGVPVANNVLASAISAGAPSVIGTNGVTVALPVAVPAAQQSQPQQPQIIQVPTGGNDNNMATFMQMMLMQQMLNNSNNNNNNNSNNNVNSALNAQLIDQLLQNSAQRAKAAEDMVNKTTEQLIERNNLLMQQQQQLLQESQKQTEVQTIVQQSPQQTVQQPIVQPIVQPVMQQPVQQPIIQPVVQQSGNGVSLDALCKLATAFIEGFGSRQQERESSYTVRDAEDMRLNRRDRRLLEDVLDIAERAERNQRLLAMPQQQLPHAQPAPQPITQPQPMLQPAQTQVVIPSNATITVNPQVAQPASQQAQEQPAQPVAEQPVQQQPTQPQQTVDNGRYNGDDDGYFSLDNYFYGNFDENQ